MMTIDSRYLSPAKKAWITRKIRTEVLKGKSKSQVAQEFHLSYKQILKRTKDIKSKRGLPQELREKIRQEVLDGKSKRRVSIELGVSEKTVQYYTSDLLLTPFRKIQTPDRTLELVKALLSEGYALASDKYGTNEYNKLKQHYPSISKIKMNGRIIFFLQGKEEVAARVFLEQQQRKIISYHDLKNITKVFRVNLPKCEKNAFLLKNRQRKLFKKQGVLKESSLREKDDSFSFFYIRRYCPFCVFYYFFLKILRIIYLVLSVYFSHFINKVQNHCCTPEEKKTIFCGMIFHNIFNHLFYTYLV